MQKILEKVRQRARRLVAWQQGGFTRALMTLDRLFRDINQSGKASGRQTRAATRAYIRLYLFFPEYYFLLIGMGIMVFVTRSFSDHSIDYGPWRPVVVTLAFLLAGAMPLLVSLLLYPLHVLKRVDLWLLTVANAVLSANIYALVEPVIPWLFYTEGILYYQDLIFGVQVFYLLGLLYLHLKLRNYVCLNCHLKRYPTNDIRALLPAALRTSPVLALYAQDHYVNIITEKGEHLHRMSLKEAMAMLPHDAGLQVHRSHWVAFDAMAELKRVSGKTMLELRNGALVPVSRSKVSEVKMRLQQQ